jgi:phage terminase small subunit
VVRTFRRAGGHKLTPKQSRFVEEYLVDLNATQAAMRAGYSARTANEQGARLLANASVRDAVQEAMNSRSERTEITTDYVLAGIREIAERCLQRAPVMVGRGEDRAQMIDEQGRHVWTFDSTGANKAFENLGKHLKLFTDRVEHSGGVTLNVLPEDAAL